MNDIRDAACVVICEARLTQSGSQSHALLAHGGGPLHIRQAFRRMLHMK